MTELVSFRPAGSEPDLDTMDPDVGSTKFTGYPAGSGSGSGAPLLMLSISNYKTAQNANNENKPCSLHVQSTPLQNVIITTIKPIIIITTTIT